MKLLHKILAPVLMLVFALLIATNTNTSNVMAAATWQPVDANIMVQNSIHFIAPRLDQENISQSSIQITGPNSANIHIEKKDGPKGIASDAPSHYNIGSNTPFSTDDVITMTVNAGKIIDHSTDSATQRDLKVKITISSIQASEADVRSPAIKCSDESGWKYCLTVDSNWFGGVWLQHVSQLDYTIELITDDQPFDFDEYWLSVGSLNTIFERWFIAGDYGESAYLYNCSVIQVSQHTLLEQFGADGCGARGIAPMLTVQEEQYYADDLSNDKYVNIAASWRASHNIETFNIKTEKSDTAEHSSMWFTPLLSPLSQTYIEAPQKFIIDSEGNKVPCEENGESKPGKCHKVAVGETENFQVDWYMPYLGANAITAYSSLVFTDTLDPIFDYQSATMKLTNTNGTSTTLTAGTDYDLSINGQTITATMKPAFRNKLANYRGQTLSLLINTKVNNKALDKGPDYDYINFANINDIETDRTKTQPKIPNLVPSKTVAKKQSLVGEEINYGLKVINQKIDEDTGNTGGKEITITDVIDTTILGDVKFTSKDAKCTSETNPLASTMTITCKSNKTLNPIEPGSAEDNADNSINIQISAIGKQPKQGHINTIVATGGGSNCTEEEPCSDDVEHDILDAPKPPAAGLITRSIVSIAVIGILTAYINNTLLGGSVLPRRK